MSPDERRAYLRYKISIPVQLENSEGVTYETSTKDISMGGTQIECNSGMLYRLLPNGLKTSRSEGIVLQARLQSQAKAVDVTITTYVQGVLRLAENDYCIRLLFADLDHAQKSQLEKLLKE